MARLFTCGLEENDFAATMWSPNTGAPTIQTTTVRSGTYALRINAAGSAQNARRALVNTVTAGTFFTRFYLRLPSLPASGTRRIFFIDSSSNVQAMFLEILSTGVLRITNAADSSTADSTISLSVNTWYRIEVRILVSDTVGELELRIDGTSEASLTGKDTLPANVFYFRFGTSLNETIEAFYDDIAINDTAGTFQTSWPGAGAIAMLVPNTEVSITWTPNTGTDNSANVDDLPGLPDDDTTYNSSATANDEDRLGLTALPAEVPSNATITLADVYARIRGEGTTASRTCRVLIWDEAGTQTVGPTTNLNDSTAYRIMDTDEHLVLDTAGKTKANLDSFDAGAEPTTSHATRMTTLWVNVEWTPPAAGPISINVSDAISIADVLTLAITPLILNLSESVTVTDAATLAIDPLLISVSESIAVSESLTLAITPLIISVFDSISVLDAATVELAGGAALTINVFESVSVSDILTLAITPLLVNVAETLTVADALTLAISPLLLNVAESIAVADALTLAITPLHVNVFELIAVSDVLTLAITPLLISVFELVSAIDAATVLLAADLSINVFEAVSVTDVLTLAITPLLVNVFEAVAVSESLALAITPLIVSVFETIAVVDALTLAISPLLISVFEILSVTDIAVTSVSIPFLFIEFTSEAFAIPALSSGAFAVAVLTTELFDVPFFGDETFKP